MSHIPLNEEKLSRAVAQKILDAVGSIRYGAVEVIVHNSKVVRIELTEKIMVDENESSRKSA